MSEITRVTKIGSTIVVSEQLLSHIAPISFGFEQMLDDHFNPPTDNERALRRLSRPIDARTDRQLRAERRREWWAKQRIRLASWVAGFDVDYEVDD